MTDGSSNRGEVAGRPTRRGWALAGVVTRVPIDRSLFGRGDLLEGIVAVAALLLMMVLSLPWLLAVLLAIATYFGVGLVRARRTHDEETIADTNPQDRRGEGTIEVRQQPAGELIVNPTVARRFGLTRRECEVLPLVAQAQRLTDKEIADCLSIDHKTVQTHVHNILGKLGLDSRRDIAAFAVQHGLLVHSLPPNGSE